MRTFIFTACAVAVLAACQPSNNTGESTNAQATAQNAAENPSSIAQSVMTESEKLNIWFDEKYEQQLQMNPLMMTFLGRKDRYDEFNAMTREEEQALLDWQAASVNELKGKFNYEKLDDDAKESYDLWLYQYQQAKEAAEFPKNGYVFTQMNGAQAFLTQFMINFHKVEDVSDMQAYNKRIVGLSSALTSLLTRAKEHAEYGVRPPKFAYQGVIEQSKNVITGLPFSDDENAQDAPLWADAKAKVKALTEAGKLDETQATELLAQTKAVLVNDYLPAYQALVAWFEKDIANADEIATGVAKQPNGVDFYNMRLKHSTTTDLTAEEIHALGLAEVERLIGEMKAIKEKVGFEGDLQAFFQFIKTDDQFFYPNTDEGRQGYITDSEAYLDYIKGQLPNYFGILPKADLVVKRVEPFREQDGAAQHYFPGTADGSRPGVYYAHLSDMRSMPKNEMEAIAYHEGNPGHHMQISIAKELTGIPKFRTNAQFTAYVEGWALYSELLAKEMGAYENDYSDFGRLITEIWRAVRLVVDTGLHAKGWTEQQAIDYFKANSPVAEDAVISEVRRYLVWPGQATAYKIGMLEILKLREYAKESLKERFDIKGFHDTVLGGGAMPLPLLEKRVKRWVNNVKLKG
ncbi:DUF885 domain-containing protein [Thalassotalea euphylliae]|uniref:DUF885 domain-containing protein n=1 Tax=Thalassotalea euphylliae TaxID=1655234 RepID=A0A3E0U1R0_9GAMM|nr:DUF885 domain-containing protein [Thalassotalea euphylliae]REL29972.1 DUF885 domain-containing protein [Thalassotalea euphylliae]